LELLPLTANASAVVLPEEDSLSCLIAS